MAAAPKGTGWHPVTDVYTLYKSKSATRYDKKVVQLAVYAYDNAQVKTLVGKTKLDLASVLADSKPWADGVRSLKTR